MNEWVKKGKPLAGHPLVMEKLLETGRAKKDYDALTKLLLLFEDSSAVDAMAKDINEDPKKALDELTKKATKLYNFDPKLQAKMTLPEFLAKAFDASPLADAGKSIASYRNELDLLKGTIDKYAQIKRDWLIDHPLADPTEIKERNAQIEEQRVFDEGLKKEEREKQLREKYQLPMSRKTDEAIEIMRAFDEGIINKDEYMAAMKKIQEDLKPKQPKQNEMLGAGSYGFRDFSQQIQNSLLQKQDPLLNETKKLTELLHAIKIDMRRVAEKDAPAGGLAPGMGGLRDMFNGIQPGGGMGTF